MRTKFSIYTEKEFLQMENGWGFLGVMTGLLRDPGNTPFEKGNLGPFKV
jgi:hypothetical protein